MPNILFPTSASQKVQNIWNTSHSLADEGSYFIATNPTPNTVIATTSSTTTVAGSQTAPVAVIYNPWPVSDPNARTIYLQYWWWMISQIPTGASLWDMAIWLEPTGANVYTSGGSLIVPVQSNAGSSVASRAKIYFGAVVAAANTSSAILVSRRRIVSAIPVTLDEWIMTFGDSVQTTDFLSNPATLKRVTIPMGPVVIPPGYAMKMGMWAAANGAAVSWEFEMGYVERVPGL